KEQLDKDMGLTVQQRQENYDKAKALVEQYLKENPAEKEPTASAPKPAAAPAASATPGTTRQATYTWDTRQVPDGIYLLRIVASDKASNPGEPLSDVKVTEPFILSNTPPQLFLFPRDPTPEAPGVTIAGFAAGRVALKGAQYRVGTGE